MSLDLAQPSAVAGLQSEIQRRALIRAVQEHPEWRLADLDDVMATASPHAKLLGGITLAELQSILEPLRLESPINSERLARAQTLSGPGFDAVVLEIVDEAGDWVRSSYVKARAGGPRWKVQNSLGRLVEAGRLKRRGITSATEYRVGRRAS